MKRLSSSFLLFLAAGLLLSSCGVQTGDPRQGGLYGWSEGMAVDRQIQKRNELASIEEDTAYQEERAQELEARAAQKQRQLNSQ